MRVEPARYPAGEAGTLTSLRLELPTDIVAAAAQEFASGDSRPVETAICHGVTPLLMGDVLEGSSVEELLDLLERYFSAVASLQFKAWSLLQTRQALHFHISAATAERRLRERLRREQEG